MALSKMPSALNLTMTEKGYFPHHFNRLENEKYVGPYPDKKFYGYENMSDKDLAKFNVWYSTVAGKVFRFMDSRCLHHGHCCRYDADDTHPMSHVAFGKLRGQFDDKVEILQMPSGFGSRLYGNASGIK